MGAPFRDLLLDPGYWRPKLDAIPLRLVLTPRPDLSRAGVEVMGLRLQAHDEKPLFGVIGKAGFCHRVEAAQVRPVEGVGPEELLGELDWLALERCECDLVFAYPAERRLEERVLDLLRVTRAARAVDGLEQAQMLLLPEGDDDPADELVIATLLRARGGL